MQAGGSSQPGVDLEPAAGLATCDGPWHEEAKKQRPIGFLVKLKCPTWSTLHLQGPGVPAPAPLCKLALFLQSCTSLVRSVISFNSCSSKARHGYIVSPSPVTFHVPSRTGDVAIEVHQRADARRSTGSGEALDRELNPEN